MVTFFDRLQAGEKILAGLLCYADFAMVAEICILGVDSYLQVCQFLIC